MIEGEQGPGLYWKYEKFIRRAEARFDSIPGVTGALFAIRRSLFKTIPTHLLLDDMYTPLQIILKGYRVVLEPEAKAYDVETELSGEFKRKVRTLAGNFQLIEDLPVLLNPLKNRLFFQFASHKLMRLLCPLMLACLLGTNILLVFTLAPGWPIYVLTLIGQATGYGLALNGLLSGEKANLLSKAALTFVTLNVAAVKGFGRYIKGDFRWTNASS
jgi:cellulose synthase/poly-beta-1,6-N-acetylglucosamine synthase-like glycosyltransferase